MDVRLEKKEDNVFALEFEHGSRKIRIMKRDVESFATLGRMFQRASHQAWKLALEYEPGAWNPLRDKEEK